RDWSSDVCSSDLCFFRQNGFGLREPGDPIRRQAEYGPLIHRFCTESAIKLDRRFVPIEHRPFHSTAAAITGDPGKIDKQSAPVTPATLLRLHEQVFEIKPGPTKPGGKIVKENGEPNWRVFLERKQNLGGGSFAE